MTQPTASACAVRAKFNSMQDVKKDDVIFHLMATPTAPGLILLPYLLGIYVYGVCLGVMHFQVLVRECCQLMDMKRGQQLRIFRYLSVVSELLRQLNEIKVL